MKKNITLALAVMLVCFVVSAQQSGISTKSTTQLTYLGKTIPLRDIQPLKPALVAKDHHEIEIDFNGIFQYQLVIAEFYS